MLLTQTNPTSPATLLWLRRWKVYAMDGALLGLFMISACVVVALVEHPASPLRQWVESTLARRAIIGVAMGLTAVILIYSPWGRRSGALMNPAVTLSHVRLGRLHWHDAAGYIAAQFIGGAAGVAITAMLLRAYVPHPAVHYVVTTPGAFGVAIAWLGECAISMLLMLTVMAVNRSPRLARFTGCFAGLLVALYITFEAPLSGMSMNPARTFASAINGGVWTGFWIYCTAPLTGMLGAIEILRLCAASKHRLCGRLTHDQRVACFIRCDCPAHHR